MWTEHTKWVRWHGVKFKIMQVQSTQMLLNSLRFDIRFGQFWVLSLHLQRKKERKGRLKQILHLFLASQGFSFPSREDDQQPTKVTGGSRMFFLLPSFLSSRAENSFWQANCRKISYPDSVSLVILLKLKKSKVTEQYQLSFLCFDRGSVMKVKSLRSIKEWKSWFGFNLSLKNEFNQISIFALMEWWILWLVKILASHSFDDRWAIG